MTGQWADLVLPQKRRDGPWLLGDVLQEVAQENDAERRGARLWHCWGVSGASWAEPWA